MPPVFAVHLKGFGRCFAKKVLDGPLFIEVNDLTLVTRNEFKYCRNGFVFWVGFSHFSYSFLHTPLLRGADIVAKDNALIAEVQAAVGDHRVRPRGAVAVVGLLESAVLLVTIGRRLHERDL